MTHNRHFSNPVIHNITFVNLKLMLIKDNRRWMNLVIKVTHIIQMHRIHLPDHLLIRQSQFSYSRVIHRMQTVTCLILELIDMFYQFTCWQLICRSKLIITNNIIIIIKCTNHQDYKSFNCFLPYFAANQKKG